MKEHHCLRNCKRTNAEMTQVVYKRLRNGFQTISSFTFARLGKYGPAFSLLRCNTASENGDL